MVNRATPAPYSLTIGSNTYVFNRGLSNFDNLWVQPNVDAGVIDGVTVASDGSSIIWATVSIFVNGDKAELVYAQVIPYYCPTMGEIIAATLTYVGTAISDLVGSVVNLTQSI
jgi:hypothetical protein